MGQYMKKWGFGTFCSTTIPSLALSTFVQVTNQPFVRTSVMLQNPKEELAARRFPNYEMMKHLYRKGPGLVVAGHERGHPEDRTEVHGGHLDQGWYGRLLGASG